MSAAYDEDLAENPFLKALRAKHRKLWAQVEEQRLVVRACVCVRVYGGVRAGA